MFYLRRIHPVILLASMLSIRILGTCSSFLFPTLSKAEVVRYTQLSTMSSWSPQDPQHVEEAREKLKVWPLDEYNAILLNEVHPRNYSQSTDKPHDVYDLIALGAGAGGLVASKQSGRRGAKSCLISEHLAGGDCLASGCVPSKALIRSARAVSAVQKSCEFGVVLPEGQVKIDFSAIMNRLRRLRSDIAPADGHEATTGTGAHVFQGRGKFIAANEMEVNGVRLQFKKAVIATGGRPYVPDIPGLTEAPYTTNEVSTVNYALKERRNATPVSRMFLAD